MLYKIYPNEIKHNEANAYDNLSISNYNISAKLYDKQDDFNDIYFSFWTVASLTLLPIVYIS